MTRLQQSGIFEILRRLAGFEAAEPHRQRFLKLATEARSHITEIDAASALALIKSGALAIDVREKEEFRRARIPGAIHLPRGTVELDIESRCPAIERQIVCYCGGGYRSALVAENLQRMGYLNVKSVAGGFHAWLAASLPIQRGDLLVED